MGIRREYYCNFCRHTYSDRVDDKRNISALAGIHWTGAGGGDTMTIRDARETENHLCHSCMKQIATLAAKAGIV